MPPLSEIFATARADETRIDLTLPDMTLLSHQVSLLRQPCPMFLSCTAAAAAETHVILTYDLSERYQLFSSRIRDCTLLEKYLILLHIGKFFSQTQVPYGTSFNPANIVVTDTFDAAFLLRILPDMPSLQRTSHEEFEEYKALILSVAQDKYSYAHLTESGLDILNKDPFFLSVIQARAPQELEQLLTQEYARIYRDTRKNRIAFHTKTFTRWSYAAAFLVAALICSLGYFVYTNITQTSTFGPKLFIYEAYYDRNPQGVIDAANKIKDEDMDPRLKRVVAEALISTNEPENLRRAFYLDSTRQVEIIEKLIPLEQDDMIAGLSSDNHMAQLYQAYYAKDYDSAIALAESHTDLRLNAQAQILRAKAYAALKNYTQAEAILKSLGDTDTLLAIYQDHRESVLANESNIELRQQLVKELDDIINLLEEVKRGEASQDAPSASPSQDG